MRRTRLLVAVGVRDAPEEILMIDPPPSLASMAGIPCRAPQTAAMTVMSNVCRQASSLEVAVPVSARTSSAALLSSTSRRPNESSAARTRLSTPSSVAMSACSATASSPSSRARTCRASSLMSPSTTRAPSRTSRRAVAAPMPLAAPVTMATFPSSRFVIAAHLSVSRCLISETQSHM